MTQDFFQSGPELTNQFLEDQLLSNFLNAHLPREFQAKVTKELIHLGHRTVSDLLQLSLQVGRQPPVHVPFDPWGKRIDLIHTCPAWDKLAEAAAEEGIVAEAYERKYGAHSRLVQFAKLYLYHASSAFYSCPLAMTDGAARAIELYGDEKLKSTAFKHLTSRNPKEFWTSGQWMTEKTGGSDVSGTSTIAKPNGDGTYSLYGTKWFTSATTAQMAMALARIEGHPEGSRGLSLFYIELRDKQGSLKNIEVHRLKDKLGTKGLPTAEITLNGTPATLVGGEGGGVKKIASLFNITRMYNSVCALSAMRRALALAKDYSKRRSAFGKILDQHGLHLETLANLEVEFSGNFLLTFHLAELLGRDELQIATQEERAILRLLTPIAKLYTAKSAMQITSEVVEIFGGAGYVEDTGLPTLLRDAQVFSIWEGTTNVLSLDVIRALEKENALGPLVHSISSRLDPLEKDRYLLQEVEDVKTALGKLKAFAIRAKEKGDEFTASSSRGLAFSIAKICGASLLLEFAHKSKEKKMELNAIRWCRNELFVSEAIDSIRTEENRTILGFLN